MYKIRHIETGKFFSNPGKRYWILSIGGYSGDEELKKKYPITTCLSNVGAVYATLRGVTNLFNDLNRYFPNVFEIVAFKEV